MVNIDKTVQKRRTKLNPEQLFAIYQECISPTSPVKLILERYGLKPWELAVIRKQIREGAIDRLSQPSTPGRKKTMVPLEEYNQVCRELSAVKDALATLGYEFSLLKKKTNSI